MLCLSSPSLMGPPGQKPPGKAKANVDKGNGNAEPVYLQSLQKALEQAEATGVTQCAEQLKALLGRKKAVEPTSPLSGTRAYIEATKQGRCCQEAGQQIGRSHRQGTVCS